MARPVLVGTLSWVEGTNISSQVQIWKAFLNNAAIKKKIDNYRYMSFNLKVKVLINASPFYYGQLGVFYHPMPDYGTGNIDIANGTRDQSLVCFSQRPHTWVYPQYNQGSEMTLPFIWNEDWLDITDEYTVRTFGYLDIWSVKPLANANSVVGTNVDIQIFAWAEDVRLCAPTHKLALQSKEKKVSAKKDEYSSDGMISKPASAIAKALGHLKDVPIIGPYATASSFLADTASNVASYFGYTNVPVIDDVSPYKSVPFHAFASPEISQPIDKLTVDPKNELSIDPRIVGSDDSDPLLVKSIVTRESYLTTVTWNASDPIDQNLFNSLVTPHMTNVASYGGLQTIMSHTPMAHVAEMFSYWKGDVIFKFKFIASQYHRGRVRVAWDPVTNISTVSDTNTTNFNKIIDISETPVVEIRVPYAQATAWLRTVTTTVVPTTSWGTTSAPAHSDRTDNGTLNMRVFTQQTSPVASAPIYIVVSVRGADNLEFAGPRDIDARFVYFAPQSKEEKLGKKTLCELSMFDSVDKDAEADLMYMGESVVSLRQLLRRTSLHRVVPHTSDTTNAFVYLLSRFSRRPIQPGFDPNGINTATDLIGAGTNNYNFVNHCGMTWLAPLFIANRGSVNWYINESGYDTKLTMRFDREKRALTLPTYSQQFSTVTAPYILRDYINSVGTGCSGLSLTNGYTQTGLSAQAPMYSRFRFLNTSPSLATLGTSADDTDDDAMTFFTLAAPTAGDNPITNITEIYCGAGTDYTLDFFLNVPTLYHQTAVAFQP